MRLEVGATHREFALRGEQSESISRDRDSRAIQTENGN